MSISWTIQYTYSNVYSQNIENLPFNGQLKKQFPRCSELKSNETVSEREKSKNSKVYMAHLANTKHTVRKFI